MPWNTPKSPESALFHSSNATATTPSSSSSSSSPTPSHRRIGARPRTKPSSLNNNLNRHVPVDTSIRPPTQRPTATILQAPSPARSPLKSSPPQHPDSSPPTQPFQVGDHVVQRTGRWKQRHGIVVDVHLLSPRNSKPSSSSSSTSRTPSPRYLVTIASPSKFWTGGRCTRKTGLLKKHEIVAKSGRGHRTTFVVMYPNEQQRSVALNSHSQGIVASSRESCPPDLVVQRVNFLLQLGTSTASSNSSVFWDLHLLLKQSAWMAAWCKTGSWHGVPSTPRSKKTRRRLFLGTSLGTVIATAIPQVTIPTAWFLSLGAVAAGPSALLLALWGASGMWKESSGKYLDVIFQQWQARQQLRS